MARPFGPPRDLHHAGCGPDCRFLCFELVDPQDRVVRLTHGQWLGILEKEGRAPMGSLLPVVRSAISAPQAIHADSADPRKLLYYSETPEGRLLLVVVKCLPRRFQHGRIQRRYLLLGHATGTGAGEAWVVSAYPLRQLKARGRPIWP